ncbi:MAG: SH3 domain-containing protein [Spirochaetota bacterium]
MKQSFFAPLLYLVIVSFLLQACSSDNLGTGVVLWSTDELNASPGEIVSVIEENDSTETYLIDRDEQEPVTIEKFRVELFDSREEAESFADEYDEVAPLYAKSRLRALPVRNRRDTDSRAVYRLQEDEIMKVLEVDPEQETITGMQGQWHRVLTAGGVEGWAFGHSLDVYDVREGVAVGDTDSEIPALGREVIERTWRPNEYYELVGEGTPALEVLSDEYGLFPDPDNNTVHIRYEDVDEEFTYTTITGSGRNNIRFQGTPLQIRRDGTNRITAFFSANDEEYTLRLRSLPRDLDEVIETEEERREQALETFLADGRRLESSEYGTIAVDEDGSFTWENSDELRPRVIPGHYGNSGELEFVYFPASSLRSDYDGVVSFSFDDTPDDERISFLYETDGSGIRLTYVPISSIDDYEVRNDTGSSLVIFMSYQEDEDEPSD